MANSIAARDFAVKMRPEPSNFLPVCHAMSLLPSPLALAAFLVLSVPPATAALPVSAVCGGATTAIADIRHPAGRSPLAGHTTSIEAIVTAAFGGPDGFGGFFVQQSDAQRRHRPGVPEGLFVYAPHAHVQPGERVHITGRIEQKYGRTQLTLAGRVAVCARGQSVMPAALMLPVDSESVFAAHEGMRVRFPQTLTVSDTYELGRYGSIVLSHGSNRAPPVSAGRPRRRRSNRRSNRPSWASSAGRRPCTCRGIGRRP